MKFRQKLISIYTLFVFGIACVLAFSYFKINEKNIQENEYEAMQNTAKQISQSVDEMISTMEFAFDYILSDQEVLSALTVLSKEDVSGSSAQEVYFSEAANIVRNKLTTDFVLKHYHRIIVFNESGSIVANSSVTGSPINYDKKISEINWVEKVKGTNGASVLIGIHTDDWTTKNSQEVISLLMEIQGLSRGYIEVQKSVEEIGLIFQGYNENMNILILTPDNELVYSSAGFLHEEYLEVAAQVDINGMEYILENVDPSSSQKEIIATIKSMDTSILVMVIQDKNLITEKLMQILPLTVTITFSFLLLSAVFVIFVSTHLTKPISTLNSLMEQTTIENLEEERTFDDAGNDEFEKLYSSYNNVLKRLKVSIIRERHLSELQLQAQLDLFQAQVNPHFLFNILNVITYHGNINRDYELCKISGSLANMIRYSTNTKTRYVTIGDELSYLEEYIYLLKARYCEDFKYNIDVEERIKAVQIPRVTFQPFVENIIKHAYKDISDIMVIEVLGWESDGCWNIKIIDRGQGFKDGIIGDITHQIDQVKRRITERDSNIGLQIGGMGIINTYTRLYLCYGKELVFLINTDAGGTEIVINAPIKEKC